jgi:phage-related protein
MLVDSYDLSDLELVISGVTGWRDGVGTSWDQVQVPGRFGSIATALEPSYPTRQLVVTGTVLGTTVADLYSKLDQIKWRIGLVEKEFAFVDDETRVFNARLTGFQSTGIQPMMTQLGTTVSITLLMLDPRIYDDSPTIVGSIGNSDVDLPLGTAPVRASINVTGSGSFTLTYKDSSAVEVATMTITGATAPVDIDMDAQTITDAGGNAVDTLTAGDFFAFDPADGDYVTPDWPTLRCGSGTAQATYTKAYL